MWSCPGIRRISDIVIRLFRQLSIVLWVVGAVLDADIVAKLRLNLLLEVSGILLQDKAGSLSVWVRCEGKVLLHLLLHLLCSLLIIGNLLPNSLSLMEVLDNHRLALECLLDEAIGSEEIVGVG